jgi:hypothetical protein
MTDVAVNSADPPAKNRRIERCSPPGGNMLASDAWVTDELVSGFPFQDDMRRIK